MKKENIDTVENVGGENVDAVDNVIETAGAEITAQKQDGDTAEEQGENQEESKEETIESVKKELEAAKAEIEELKKQALYKQADFENYRKNAIKKQAELVLAGGEKTVVAILPVLDDFERALADKSEDPQAIRQGMQLIFQKFQKTLEGLGVKKIETADAEFNVDYHEAIARVPGMGEDKKNKVIDCVQTGYTLNDKVIRYAKVAVGE